MKDVMRVDRGDRRDGDAEGERYLSLLVNVGKFDTNRVPSPVGSIERTNSAWPVRQALRIRKGFAKASRGRLEMVN
jgi:hypothetical protein